MMRLKKIFTFAICAFVLSAQAFAFVPQPTPNIIGSTGVIRVPSADVIPYKNINFGLDFGSDISNNKFSLFYKFALGTFQGMELGCVGMDDRNGAMQEGVFINMKYSLATDTSPNPLFLAIGVENLSSFTRCDVYMVATKYFPNGARLHFGFLGDFPGWTDSRFRPLGAFGYDTPFFSEKLYFLMDMLAGESLYELNLGFRSYISDSFSMNFSAMNILADDNRKPDEKARDKDPKAILIGFSWLNPL
ncbi:MAG: hypothetical protein ABH860_05000 [bacterium]